MMLRSGSGIGGLELHGGQSDLLTEGIDLGRTAKDIVHVGDA